ncbi:protein of unknown function [Maridesulfovibrio hydrothermalis AM13 = DSM 14728]|uniref:Uncharacterized protein n=1 Tax=Maridesulfovibrio hydrothermalis AM13 = DSM 14728 TaxID=1121451 RepID=L0REL9_9BACT|nr:protein of unknown function [Maridesulfovibrio hydrothermalis AM13 = DSM 14728]
MGRSDVITINENFAGSWWIKPDHMLEYSTFTAPRTTQDHKDLPFLHLERNIINDDGFSISASQVLHVYYIFVHVTQFRYP